MRHLAARVLTIVTLIATVATQACADGIVHSIEPSPPGRASAVYIEATGELVFSIGSSVALVGIGAPGLLKQGLTPTLGAKPPDQYDDVGLAYVNYSDGLPEGIFSQGPLFDAGLDHQYLLANTGFTFQSPLVDDTLIDICYLPVPEPANALLILMAIALPCSLRRFTVSLPFTRFGIL